MQASGQIGQDLFGFKTPQVTPRLSGKGQFTGKYECLTGNHTVQALVRTGIKTIEVVIVEGAEWNEVEEDEDERGKKIDAELLKLAVSDNSKHGYSYTREDIRHNILLLRERIEGLSHRDIAKLVGCSKSHVSNVLNETDAMDTEDTSTGKSKVGKTASRKCLKNETKPFTAARSIATLLKSLRDNIEQIDEVADIPALADMICEILKILEEREMEEPFIELLCDELCLKHNDDDCFFLTDDECELNENDRSCCDIREFLDDDDEEEEEEEEEEDVECWDSDDLFVAEPDTADDEDLLEDEEQTDEPGETEGGNDADCPESDEYEDENNEAESDDEEYDDSENEPEEYDDEEYEFDDEEYPC